MLRKKLLAVIFGVTLALWGGVASAHHGTGHAFAKGHTKESQAAAHAHLGKHLALGKTKSHATATTQGDDQGDDQNENEAPEAPDTEEPDEQGDNETEQPEA